jgi:gamma-glutamylaminecyclotransferase
MNTTQPPAIPVFVYGTLKRGHHNHRLLDHAGATFVREARTARKFPLIVDGLPFLYDRPGEGHSVRGELYLVDAPTLERLDRLEGHPRFYKRRTIALREVDSPKALHVAAWVYFIQSREPSPEDKPLAQF